MATEIEQLYFQRFIPEEGRGGTYHVVLNVDGKLVGPMTPSEADKRGFPLSAIFADIDAQLAMTVDFAREAMTRMQREREIEMTRASIVANGASDILTKATAMLSPEGAALIAVEIEALNRRLEEVKADEKTSEVKPDAV